MRTTFSRVALLFVVCTVVFLAPLPARAEGDFEDFVVGQADESSTLFCVKTQCEDLVVLVGWHIETCATVDHSAHCKCDATTDTTEGKCVKF